VSGSQGRPLCVIVVTVEEGNQYVNSDGSRWLHEQRRNVKWTSMQRPVLAVRSDVSYSYAVYLEKVSKIDMAGEVVRINDVTR
jgi:hypothetical protein